MRLAKLAHSSALTGTAWHQSAALNCVFQAGATLGCLCCLLADWRFHGELGKVSERNTHAFLTITLIPHGTLLRFPWPKYRQEG